LLPAQAKGTLLQKKEDMKLHPTRTPDKLTREIIDGCSRLVPGTKPVFIERRPAPGAQVNKCTLNLRRYLAEHSGSMVLGWDISVWENVLLDCIGHAVVQTDDGFLCVSPSKYGETSLLFLPDDSLEFDFDNSMARMPSKRIPLSSKPEVQQFIDVEAEQLLIRSKYPVSSGQIVVRGADAIALQKLGLRKQQLMLRLLLGTTPPRASCFCGSGRQFRKCCKSRLETMVSGTG
jgi:hypothetical protein